MTARWPHTSIHTPRALERKSRRLDRQNATVARVLAEMRCGASLHLAYSPRRHWRLSTGVWVTDEIAAVIITMPEIAACGDGLFKNVPGQAWRWIED